MIDGCTEGCAPRQNVRVQQYQIDTLLTFTTILVLEDFPALSIELNHQVSAGYPKPSKADLSADSKESRCMGALSEHH